ncbi:hypothetical protein D8Y22_05560 [Salinadaptatus halalkaliphilus]|uniref:Uncharacterized protein n=1 Tax=Salinadaptatus halalkaliphilus TaxID=2419781 RepID=A0A4S3TNJ4_9EURY|nr:hypothetical protein [Salinadaptatus halalkaliphilus]THE65852.1 hypothetical protein D8Y22_05560 [Salinadaptatus halalkaliphilus]
MSNPFDDLKEDDGPESTAAESPDADESASGDETTTEIEQSTVAANETTADSSTPSDDLSSAAIETDSSSSKSPTTRQSKADNNADTSGGLEPVSPAESGPAFEYSDVQQKPFYARSETVDQFESVIRTIIVPKLAQAEVLDEETREIHDAVLRLANEQPERVAELVLEERRQVGQD